MHDHVGELVAMWRTVERQIVVIDDHDVLGHSVIRAGITDSHHRNRVPTTAPKRQPKS